MCSELTPRAHIPDTRIPQLMQPWGVIDRSTFHPSGPQSGCFDMSTCLAGGEIGNLISQGSEWFRIQILLVNISSFSRLFSFFKIPHQSEYQNTNSSYSFQGFSIFFLQFFILLDRLNHLDLLLSCCEFKQLHQLGSLRKALHWKHLDLTCRRWWINWA